MRQKIDNIVSCGSDIISDPPNIIIILMISVTGPLLHNTCLHNDGNIPGQN